jgi:hypothetical protein
MTLKRSDHRLSLPLDRRVYSYGDELRNMVVFHVARPLLLQSLQLRFSGAFTASIPRKHQNGIITFRKRTTRLFEHSLPLIPQPVSLEADDHTWSYKFFWPERSDHDLAPTLSVEYGGASCSFQYTLEATAEFIDSTHEKEITIARQHLAFVDGRNREFSEPGRNSTCAALTKPKTLSIMLSTMNRIPIIKSLVHSHHIGQFLRVDLTTPSFIVAKSLFSISLTAQNTDSTASEEVGVLRLVELEIRLRGKFIVGDWDLMRSKDNKTLAEIRTANLVAAPQLASNIPLEISSICRLHVANLRTSFESNDVSLSYCWQIKARFECHGRTLLAEWSDIPVQVLSSYVHGEDALGSMGSRQPSYKYVPPPYALLAKGTCSREYLPPPTYNLV